MNSSFNIWENAERFEITTEFICDLNFYAAHYLSPLPGILRGDQNTCNVEINGSPHTPPKHENVSALMREFIEKLRELDRTQDATYTAAYVLWRLNWIHPFAQGNGRTARAACYFYLCQKFACWLPGTIPLHELIRNERDEYCRLLIEADASVDETGNAELQPIQAFLVRLLVQQLASTTTR